MVTPSAWEELANGNMLEEVPKNLQKGNMREELAIPAN
jgi:hypothetical protein